MLDPGGQLLRAALGFAGCSMPSYDHALHALRSWLDSWSGMGHIAVGMHRRGYDLQLTQYDDRGWRATSYTTGMEHSPTSATGSAWGAQYTTKAEGMGWDFRSAVRSWKVMGDGFGPRLTSDRGRPFNSPSHYLAHKSPT